MNRGKPSNVQALKKNRSFKRFIGFEVAVTIGSVLAAWYIGSLLYPLSPGPQGAFATIGALIPQPFTATAYQAAYLSGGAIVWTVSNLLLFFSGLRRL